MINDPYKVLGISPNASDDDIKRAYRELSRKYHPDSYVDNPLKDLAEERFKEVQEAYDEIIRQRQNRGYSGNYGQNRGYSGNYGQSSSYSGSYSQSSNTSGGYGQSDAKYQNIYNFINFRQYRNALNALNTMSDRDSRWYYLSAIANAGLGNNYQANADINMACQMEPGNSEYANFRNQLQMSSQRYQARYDQYNAPANRGGDCGTGSLCCDLWIADTCCECMGGDLCRCM